jgi:hypothetical protein
MMDKMMKTMGKMMKMGRAQETASSLVRTQWMTWTRDFIFAKLLKPVFTMTQSTLDTFSTLSLRTRKRDCGWNSVSHSSQK